MNLAPAGQNQPAQADIDADVKLVVAAVQRISAAIVNERARLDRVQAGLGEIADIIAATKATVRLAPGSNDTVLLLDELEHRVDAMMEIAGHAIATAAQPKNQPKKNEAQGALIDDEYLRADGMPEPQPQSAENDRVPTVSGVVLRMARGHEVFPPDPGIAEAAHSKGDVDRSASILQSMVEAMNVSILATSPKAETAAGTAEAERGRGRVWLPANDFGEPVANIEPLAADPIPLPAAAAVNFASGNEWKSEPAAAAELPPDVEAHVAPPAIVAAEAEVEPEVAAFVAAVMEAMADIAPAVEPVAEAEVAAPAVAPAVAEAVVDAAPAVEPAAKAATFVFTTPPAYAVVYAAPAVEPVAEAEVTALAAAPAVAEAVADNAPLIEPIAEAEVTALAALPTVAEAVIEAAPVAETVAVAEVTAFAAAPAVVEATADVALAVEPVAEAEVTTLAAAPAAVEAIADAAPAAEPVAEVTALAAPSVAADTVVDVALAIEPVAETEVTELATLPTAADAAADVAPAVEPVALAEPAAPVSVADSPATAQTAPEQPAQPAAPYDPLAPLKSMSMFERLALFS